MNKYRPIKPVLSTDFDAKKAVTSAQNAAHFINCGFIQLNAI